MEWLSRKTKTNDRNGTSLAGVSHIIVLPALPATCILLHLPVCLHGYCILFPEASACSDCSAFSNSSSICRYECLRSVRHKLNVIFISWQT